MRASSFFIAALGIVATANTGKVSASILAADSAADAAYNGGWAAGSNGGYGFGPWSFTTLGITQHFVGTSTTNGDGDGNSSGDIDTSGRAWGLSAGGEIHAVRPFTGALAVGQSVNISMDHGFIQEFRWVGVGLTSNVASWGTREVEFYIMGPHPCYQVFSGSSSNSPLCFTDGGLNLEFELTSSSTYSLTVTRFHDTQSPQTWNTTGTLRTSNPIRGLYFFSSTPGSAYINSLSLTPEPSSLAMLALSLVAVRRRRSK
jgi:PEP-CTERM motif-containing protein